MAGIYYNEHDAYAAQWLRNLMAEGLIPEGEVDERSIKEVRPDEIREFTQCHFFAGIGIWAGALRDAGWPDELPVWTGSCPCQPFSNAGKQEGFEDERHLWPDWLALIRECRPSIVLGEQVASALEWLDLVSADLEEEGFAFGALDLCAAGFPLESWHGSGQGEWLRRALLDCPDPMLAADLRNFADFADRELGSGDASHIRQRIYFVGMDNASSAGLERSAAFGDPGEAGRPDAERTSAPGGMADAAKLGLEGAIGRAGPGKSRASECGRAGGMANSGDRRFRRGSQEGDGSEGEAQGEAWQRERGRNDDRDGGPTRRMADADGGQSWEAGAIQSGGEYGCEPEDGGASQGGSASARGMADAPGSRHDGKEQGPEGEAWEGSRMLLPSEIERAGGMAHSKYDGGRTDEPERRSEGRAIDGGDSEGPGRDGSDDADPADRSRRAVDWLLCRDGKWRAVGSGSFPLADASPARVGRLRAYGNALDFGTAKEFAGSVLEIIRERLSR